MGSKHVTEQQKREFWTLYKAGMSATQAAEKAGFSRQTGWRMVRGISLPAKSLIEAERMEEAQPTPKTFDELDGGVKDLLSDFGLFSEVILLRRRVPWRTDAANRIVDALADKSRRDYFVVNEPPGSGKSTLFTHDVPAWLIAGGGLCDPLQGRALRAMLGSYALPTATHYVARLRRLLESPRPYYEKATQRRAELSIVKAFGRFKPSQQGLPWTNEEFIVAQLEDVDLYEKEPTVQAASREKGFLGERVDFYSWDDLVTTANVRTRDVREQLAEWTGDEVETRLEPGGVGLLVGQRLGPDDLYRDRLDVHYIDEAGESRRKYAQIRYPAHNEATCETVETQTHRQWDARTAADGGQGCLLDAERLPWHELQAIRQSDPRKYRMIYQQEDVDPTAALIDDAWIDGGLDREQQMAPGCLDTERGFGEWPPGVSGLIDYVCVDPSAGHWWGFLWWSIAPTTGARYLIRGKRSARFKAGDLLQWDIEAGKLTGLMQDWQEESAKAGHLIRAWVLEGNSAFKHLTQYDHSRRFKQQWPATSVILHKTGMNKHDERTGVEALLPKLYRAGLKRLPARVTDFEARHFIEDFRKELTQYPDGATWDLVMADWFGEWNIAQILSAARRSEENYKLEGAKFPRYLERQAREFDWKAEEPVAMTLYGNG